MLIEVADILALDEYAGVDSEVVRDKILGIESAIRAYTNNDFTVRTPSNGGVLRGSSAYIKVGDRVQIVDSGNWGDYGSFTHIGMNNGLYDVQSVSDGVTTLDVYLYDMDVNDILLVRYPEAIKTFVNCSNGKQRGAIK